MCYISLIILTLTFEQCKNWIFVNKHIHTHTHSLSHTLTLSHSLTPTLTHTLLHTLTHSYSHSHTHILSLTHSYTHSHTHSHTPTLTHTLLHTLTHSYTLPVRSHLRRSLLSSEEAISLHRSRPKLQHPLLIDTLLSVLQRTHSRFYKKFHNGQVNQNFN